MATDEEHKEAEERARIIVGKLFEDCTNKAYEKGKKEGIQMERERLRKQVKKDTKVPYNKKGKISRNYVIDMNDIDIWDDE